MLFECLALLTRLENSGWKGLEWLGQFLDEEHGWEHWENLGEARERISHFWGFE